MKSNKILLGLLLIALFLSFTVPKKRVFIIGDSISLGYFPVVKQSLTNEAEVSHNPGNAQHTGTGLKRIDEWLGKDKYDMILFNWGLWDLCYRHPDSKMQGQRDKLNGKITYTVDKYRANLEELVKRLKMTKAKLIFVTTTVVPEGEAGRFKGDEIIYNNAAKAIMKKHNIEVFDLHKYSIPIHNDNKAGEGDVHYTAQGYQKLGEHIAKAIKKHLN